MYCCLINHKQGSFNFSDTVDGSALIYSINYMDSNSSSLCASAEVPATSCLNQTCEYIFTKSNFLACLTLSQSIMVTVFGANRLGNGSRSDPVSIGNQTLYNHKSKLM